MILIEIVFRIVLRNTQKYGKTYVKDVNLLSSKVTQLIINRPKYFRFKAGDYVRIKIPEISLDGFHAFTISSAPENKSKNYKSRPIRLSILEILFYF